MERLAAAAEPLERLAVPAVSAPAKTPSSAALSRRLALAVDVAREAAALLMHHRGRLTEVAFKGAVDLVTEADRGAERLVLERLAAALPEDLLVGEEGGGAGPAEAPFAWFVDPLDGTTNFVHGLPHFCVSLGLTWRASPLTPLEPVLGVIAAPALAPLGASALGTLWSGALGLGATRSGLASTTDLVIPLAVSRVDTLDRALVATGFPYDRQDTSLALIRPLEAALHRVHCVRRLGSAALDLAQVADGTFAAYWEPRLKPWDLAAGVALVREAGGRVTDLGGGDSILESGDVLATNGLLHEPFLREILGIASRP
jgi:myo-inositol-1(or 4)-monophosphatase